ncbi:glycosyltransferase family 39 protein [Streptomyces thinghirensis]|nr:glycosyltransferase family 39 protein [Streptomyces thinghirensis]
MLPLLLAALATIWILHSSVKRVWGHGAAAIAALVLALTPITVAINRDNNPDTLLVFLMVAGAALGLRAVRDGRLLPLIGSAVCFGLAFNTKMLQGYIALPAIFLVYVYATNLGWAKRIRNLVLAAVALAVSSFWWAAAVSAVPASERPYIGGSTDGTAWDLITGYNGLGRIFGGDGNMGGGGGGGGGFSGAAGIGRLFNDVLGGQISWLLPFAGIALVGGLVLCGRAPPTDLARAALVLWGRLDGVALPDVQHGRGHHAPVLHDRARPGHRGAVRGRRRHAAARLPGRPALGVGAAARPRCHRRVGDRAAAAGPRAGTPGCGRPSRRSRRWRSRACSSSVRGLGRDCWRCPWRQPSWRGRGSGGVRLVGAVRFGRRHGRDQPDRRSFDGRRHGRARWRRRPGRVPGRRGGRARQRGARR